MRCSLKYLSSKQVTENQCALWRLNQQDLIFNVIIQISCMYLSISFHIYYINNLVKQSIQRKQAVCTLKTKSFSGQRIWSLERIAARDHEMFSFHHCNQCKVSHIQCFTPVQPLSSPIYFGPTSALNDWNCSKTEFSEKKFQRISWQFHLFQL